MAKEQYEYPYTDEKGRYTFRTIGGRKVKIYENQSLADAMIESGKFKATKTKPGLREAYRKQKNLDNHQKVMEYFRAGKEIPDEFKVKYDEIDENKPSMREDYRKEKEFENNQSTNEKDFEKWRKDNDTNNEEILNKEKSGIYDKEVLEKARENQEFIRNEVKKNVEKEKSDPYDDPESEESQRLQSIQSRYDDYLQKTEGRGASYGEIAHIDSLRGKDLDDFEAELDDFEAELDDFEESDLDKVKRIQKNLSNRKDLTDAEKKWKDELADTQKKLESGMSREDIIKEKDEKVRKEIEEQEKKSNEQFEVGDLKKKAQEILPKEDIDTHDSDLYIKKTDKSTELLNRMKNKDSGLLSTFKNEQTGETWYDIPFGNMQDDYKEKTTNEIMNNAIREKASKKNKVEEDLPKATEIKEQGNSNRKQVSDNIQAHILDYYTSDFTGEDISPSEAFVRQMDAMSWLPNNWKRGEEIAKGGSYLIYNQDMADFLDSLKINPKGKTFSDDKAFDMYVSLVGRESAKLYDRIKRNQYNQYKKEHPLSNMSFADFKDMINK